MVSYDLIKDLTDYYKEAFDRKYSEHTIEFDINRILEMHKQQNVTSVVDDIYDEVQQYVNNTDVYTFNAESILDIISSYKD